MKWLKYTRTILASALLLTALYAGTRWFVERNRPPGAMTPIEAQAMDMGVMKPPPGAFPVSAQTVEYREFLPTVTYTGTFFAYNEEQVLARVSGKLTQTFVYPGQEVRKGQLLATLEPQEYQTRADEATGALQSAIAERDEAQQEHAMANAAVQAQQAGVSSAQNRVEEAQNDIQSAEAAVRRVQANRKEIEAGIQSAEADLAYWQRETARLTNLLDKGFVAKREVDQAQTQVANMQAKARALQAALEVNQAEQQERSAALQAARARLKTANADLQAAQALLRSTQSGVRAAQAKVRRMDAMIREKQGATGAAQLQVQYTELRALNDGIVTERSAAPGTLLMPGTPVFRIQDTSRIRAQAQVADVDAARLKTGFPVFIRRYAEPNKIHRAKITAIFRAADPQTRTVTVEALLPNPKGEWNPGEYVEMKIGLQAHTRQALTIPQQAVRYDTQNRPFVWTVVKALADPAVVTEYTCVMHPEIRTNAPGVCPICRMDLTPVEQSRDHRAKRAFVQLEERDGGQIEVIKGLQHGDQVITAGFETLVEEDPVFLTEWTAQGPRELAPPGGTGSETLPGTSGGHRH
ncbi:MAG: efflux RND transporter periplasmic adaptor subunit [Fimbriimonadia bacterium]|nr:efflux RND transporter periplasmic adaptor subunit [Fimbriimonadia bacterium]